LEGSDKNLKRGSRDREEGEVIGLSGEFLPSSSTNQIASEERPLRRHGTGASWAAGRSERSGGRKGTCPCKPPRNSSSVHIRGSSPALKKEDLGTPRVLQTMKTERPKTRPSNPFCPYLFADLCARPPVKKVIYSRQGPQVYRRLVPSVPSIRMVKGFYFASGAALVLLGGPEKNILSKAGDKPVERVVCEREETKEHTWPKERRIAEINFVDLVSPWGLRGGPE